MNINTSLHPPVHRAVTPTDLPGSYTIDDYDLDPDADYHQLTSLFLKTDGSFVMQGNLNGGDMNAAGKWEVKDQALLLRDQMKTFKFDLSHVQADNLWMGAHVDSESNGRAFPVTIHRLPDGGEYHGPLSHEEHHMVGSYNVTSQRFGGCQIKLDHDRSSEINGTIEGKPVAWMGKWMFKSPMIYVNVGSTDEPATVALHKEHGGGHGGHLVAGDSSEVDVIVNVPQHLGEYNMTMTAAS